MPAKSSLKETLVSARQAFLAVLVFSMCINFLMLAAPIHMLQIFDRVLSSRSTDTLLLLSLITVVAILTLALLDGIRSNIMMEKILISLKF